MVQKANFDCKGEKCKERITYIHNNPGMKLVFTGETTVDNGKKAKVYLTCKNKHRFQYELIVFKCKNKKPICRQEVIYAREETPVVRLMTSTMAFHTHSVVLCCDEDHQAEYEVEVSD